MNIEDAKKLLEKIFEDNKDKGPTLLQGLENEKRHAYLVLEWAEKLSPNASLNLRLAALFHDIDRILVKGVGSGFKGTTEAYKAYKKQHAQRAADCIWPILVQNGLSEEDAQRVSFLISHHDDGRQELDQLKDDELEVVVAADTLAFFDTFGIKTYSLRGQEALEAKIKFMGLKMAPLYRKFLIGLKINDEVLQTAKDKVTREIFK